MQITSYLILSILISLLLFSCNKDYVDISQSEFLENVLPKAEINSVSIENNELFLVATSDNKTYSVKDEGSNSFDVLLNKIQSENQNIEVSYAHGANSFGHIFFLIPFLIPFLILLHILFLWIALRRIIQSAVAPTEKLVYTIISIFVPLVGPLIYLTTKKNRA
ncbi:PLD nuclease N-terminal domain-containing protein [Arenibacter latericius]|uniref:PLD nuclease N-terminal domain-containing protein n=1 Tax=Arenibacter latericius TaxID=86104 RepID=UPI000425A889|nr:PLD nuclease N-terminal domain-containing protein [Arenibacter latericius]